MHLELIETRLKEHFGEAVYSAELLYDFPVVTVEKDKLHEILKFLKEDPELNFHFLTTLCGLHYPEAGLPYGIMVQLHNMPANTRLRIKSFTSDKEPVFHTLTALWPSANWMERETYDFFGYRFSGHPDLRRILNMDSLEGWPMRKEYPLEDPFRKDKDDKMFGR
ncbi:MAG: NADH-quinone oxidoreductase subunit C [Bacteroidia bacterium]|nr:NADH-quinone oxidoreductase subunit C [Bacteroidia bacterium]